MPSIESRIMTEKQQASIQTEAQYSYGNTGGGAAPDTSLGSIGNPAPIRGTFPISSMFDFQTKLLYPDNPFFDRGVVRSNSQIYNLALLAQANATKP